MQAKQTYVLIRIEDIQKGIVADVRAKRERIRGGSIGSWNDESRRFLQDLIRNSEHHPCEI